MTRNKFEQYEYTVNNRPGFGLTDALRLWKTKYSDIKDFDKEVITHEGMYPFRDFVHEIWEDIEPVTIQEALSRDNTEERRTYFDCIGVQKLFEQLQPTLRDKQIIKKKRTRWDDSNSQYEYEFEDVYELYELDGKQLFEKDSWGRPPQPVFAVRCWCTTTNREYWIYVNEEAATGRNTTWWAQREKAAEYDAIRAIAWTIRLDVENPERIYRQGDIIVAKIKPIGVDKAVQPYHLTKDQYLNLMYSET